MREKYNIIDVNNHSAAYMLVMQYSQSSQRSIFPSLFLSTFLKKMSNHLATLSFLKYLCLPTSYLIQPLSYLFSKTLLRSVSYLRKISSQNLLQYDSIYIFQLQNKISIKLLQISSHLQLYELLTKNYSQHLLILRVAKFPKRFISLIIIKFPFLIWILPFLLGFRHSSLVNPIKEVIASASLVLSKGTITNSPFLSVPQRIKWLQRIAIEVGKLKLKRFISFLQTLNCTLWCSSSAFFRLIVSRNLIHLSFQFVELQPPIMAIHYQSSRAAIQPFLKIIVFGNIDFKIIGFSS